MKIVIDKENLINTISIALYVVGGKSEYKDAKKVTIELIEQVGYTPSAEPKRCKDCEWLEKSDNSLQWRCKRYGFYPTGEYYCGGAPKGQHDNERATDQSNHEILYEPTFNQNDG